MHVVQLMQLAKPYLHLLLSFTHFLSFYFVINVPAVLIWTGMDAYCTYATGQNFVHTIKREGAI